MSVLFKKVSNILEAANNYKQNVNLYYTLKDYIFRKVCFVLTQNKSALEPNELTSFEKSLNEFKAESNKFSSSNFMGKQDYINFLESFFSKLDFDSANPFMIQVSKDLTEVLEVYGQLDELWVQRSNKITLIFS